MRGEVFALKSVRGIGSEQQGQRYAVIVQSDDMAISTVLVAPTSSSARSVAHRPGITVRDTRTRVMVEQTVAVSYERLGAPVGRVTLAEMQAIDDALLLVLGLR